MLAFGSNNTVQNQGATVLGSHGQAVAVDSLALGNNTLADVQNSVALGTNSTTEEPISTDHIYINGEKYDFAGGVANSTVSIGTTPPLPALFVVPIDSWNRLVYLGFVNSIDNLYSGR